MKHSREEQKEKVTHLQYREGFVRVIKDKVVPVL
jgi:hypothetical protein